MRRVVRRISNGFMVLVGVLLAGVLVVSVAGTWAEFLSYGQLPDPAWASSVIMVASGLFALYFLGWFFDSPSY